MVLQNNIFVCRKVLGVKLGLKCPKCALSWQNSLILCNHEELENIYTVFM